MKNMRINNRDKMSLPWVFVAAMDRAFDFDDLLQEWIIMSEQNLGLPATPAIAKAQAKRLRTALAPEYTVGHGRALELVARVHGEMSWGRLNSLIGAPDPEVGDDPEVTPQGVSAPRSSPLAGETLEQRAIKALLNGLEKAKDTAPTSKTGAIVTELKKQEIVELIWLEDWLDTLDRNLGAMVFDMGADTIIKLSGATKISRFERPKARDHEVYGTAGLRPAGFAAVLIWLERLGFDTHPEIYYENFISQIKRAALLDADELTCIWHARERKKFKTFEAFNGGVVVDEPEHVSFTGRTGLKVRAKRSSLPSGLIESVQIFR